MLTVSVYIDEIKQDLILDSSYVVSEYGGPIYGTEADEKCLWPSFIIKAMAKIFGSYAALEEKTLEDLLNAVYGPSFIQSELSLRKNIDGTPVEKILKKTKLSIMNS